jgi:hypothetical protein
MLDYTTSALDNSDKDTACRAWLEEPLLFWDFMASFFTFPLSSTIVLGFRSTINCCKDQITRYHVLDTLVCACFLAHGSPLGMISTRCEDKIGTRRVVKKFKQAFD